MVIGIQSGSTHMMELKGSNIEDAFEQVYCTVNYLGQDIDLRKLVISRTPLDAYIASPQRQKIPNIPSDSERKLAKKLAGGNRDKPKDMFDLIHFVKVVNYQQKATTSGRKIIISGRTPLELS